jgi:hypothetical protein
MNLNHVLSIVVVAGALSATSAAQLPGLGASVGLYMPVDSDVRDAFGSSILRFGFGQDARTRTGNLLIGTSLDIVTANKHGNRLFLAPFTVSAEQALTLDRNASMKPYIKGFLGAAYIDFSIERNGSHYDDKVLRAVYGAEFGVVMSDRLRLSARYTAYPKTGRFDFSVLTLSATFSLTP